VSEGILDFAIFEATLVESLIMPHIEYGGIVYPGADAASQRRLNMAFRACLRYIHSLRRLDHVAY
jgi:hypothetical protein